MKATLLILVIALGGLSVWQMTDGKKKLAAARAEAMEKPEAEKQAEYDLRDAKKQVNELEFEVDRLKILLKDRDDKIAVLSDYEAQRKAEIAAADARMKADEAANEAARTKANSSEAALQIRLAEMKKTYDFHLANLTDQKARLVANREKVTTHHRQLADNPPIFKKRDPFANRGGVVVSQADQERAKKDHAEKVTAAAAQLTAIQNEIISVDTKLAELDAAYQAAVDKARAEALAAQ